MGGAVGRLDGEPKPFVTAGWPLPPRRSDKSDMDAFSSIRSGVNGFGYLSASSTAQRMALWVCLEMWTNGCVDECLARREEVLGGTRDDGRVAEASSSGSVSRSCESCLTGGEGRSCFARGRGSSLRSAVAKRPGGLIPTETASKWTALFGEDLGWGLGVPMKRGVRRRPRCEDSGVDLSDLDPWSEEIEASAL